MIQVGPSSRATQDGASRHHQLAYRLVLVFVLKRDLAAGQAALRGVEKSWRQVVHFSILCFFGDSCCAASLGPAAPDSCLDVAVASCWHLLQAIPMGNERSRPAGRRSEAPPRETANVRILMMKHLVATPRDSEIMKERGRTGMISLKECGFQNANIHADIRYSGHIRTRQLWTSTCTVYVSRNQE